MGNATAVRFETALKVWGRRVTDQWGSELADAMRPEAPLGKVTPTSRAPGELRKSIDTEATIPTGGGYRFRLVAPVIQAATTDKGARPHVIRARNAPMLRFWWAKGPRGAGIYHFLSVNHPGNAAQNWWAPGLARQGPPALRRAARRVPF